VIRFHLRATSKVARSSISAAGLYKQTALLATMSQERRLVSPEEKWLSPITPKVLIFGQGETLPSNPRPLPSSKVNENSRNESPNNPAQSKSLKKAKPEGSMGMSSHNQDSSLGQQLRSVHMPADPYDLSTLLSIDPSEYGSTKFDNMSFIQVSAHTEAEQDGVPPERIAASKRAAEQLLLSMTKEKEALVRKVLSEIGPSMEVSASRAGSHCRRGSIQSLNPGEKLSEELMHFYMAMLGARDKKLVKEGKRSKRSHYFNPCFMSTLLNLGRPRQHGTYSYQNVNGWSRLVPGTCNVMVRV
jgi:hypothetical protein